MTFDQIRAAREAASFRPFTIRMADGRSFRVPHRDFLWYTPGGRTIFVATGDDTYSIVDGLPVTELDFGPSRPSPAERP